MVLTRDSAGSRLKKHHTLTVDSFNADTLLSRSFLLVTVSVCQEDMVWESANMLLTYKHVKADMYLQVYSFADEANAFHPRWLLTCAAEAAAE